MEDKEFYLVVLPGLEDLAQAEVADWFPALSTKAEHGGVTVLAPLEVGLTLNLALKTPTRILLRVATFRCRDFPKLFNHVLQLAWEKWLDPSVAVEVHASAARSRLKIKARIAQTVHDAWLKRQKKSRVIVAPDKTVGLFVRIVDDNCTLSLDTSGERLHKRGLRTRIGEAPLRETIAAGLLLQLGRGESDGRLVELVDPMTGSGTFLLEAVVRDRLIDTREFAPANFAAGKTSTPRLHVPRPTIASLVGFEVDAKSLANAKANLDACNSTTPVRFFREDIFKAKPLPPAGQHTRWVLANPPYGERLKIKGPLDEYYANLFAATERVIRPEKACFLLPSKAVHGRLRLPPAWKVAEKRKFLNGGIPVTAFLFTRV